MASPNAPRQQPAAQPQPAPAPSPAVVHKPHSQLAATALGSFTARVLLIGSGLGFVIGFFMPWLHLGNAAAMSGLGLLVSKGELVDMVAGPNQFLIFAVPLLGTGLVVGGITGHRVGAWIALIAGLAVILGGLYTLISLFLSSTGLGMWIVVVSALVSLTVALLTLGRPRKGG